MKSGKISALCAAACGSLLTSSVLAGIEVPAEPPICTVNGMSMPADVYVEEGEGGLVIVGGPDAGADYNGVLKGWRDQPNVIVGTEIDDRLIGGDYDDLICALAGDDVVKASNGDDKINGGDGDDSIFPGKGSDYAQGGVGDDFISDDSKKKTETNILKGGRGSDTIYGGLGMDIMNGGRGADVLGGSGGDDIMNGGMGPDQLYGNNGNDTMFATNDSTDYDGKMDWLNCGNGVDTIYYYSSEGDDFTPNTCENPNDLSPPVIDAIINEF